MRYLTGAGTAKSSRNQEAAIQASHTLCLISTSWSGLRDSTAVSVQSECLCGSCFSHSEQPEKVKWQCMEFLWHRFVNHTPYLSHEPVQVPRKEKDPVFLKGDCPSQIARIYGMGDIVGVIFGTYDLPNLPYYQKKHKTKET